MRGALFSVVTNSLMRGCEIDVVMLDRFSSWLFGERDRDLVDVVECY